MRPMSLIVLASLTWIPIQAQAQVRAADPPAVKDSGMAHLTTDSKGAAYLSWIDPLTEGGHALRYARWMGEGWSAPNTIVAGKNWFINWADFPALAITQDGSFLAHWLTRTQGSGAYGYGIRVARKAPGGTAWKEVFGANLNDTEDYAGFLSFVVTGDSAGAVYLAPPPAAERTATVSHNHETGSASGDVEHRKTLRHVSFTAGGAVAMDREIDRDTCSCCQTTVVSTPRGLLAAYRDHAPGEIRDISVVRLVNGAWTEPKPLHRDGWKINGCPTEGPSAAVHGEQVGIAWLTRAQETPRIQMSLSHNSGQDFAAPLKIDDGNPYGRPVVTMFDPSSFLVAWIEKTPNGADLRLRRISNDGVKAPSVTITALTAGRSTGLPRIAITGDQILLAWRDDRVRAGVISKAKLIAMEKSAR